MGSNFTEKVLLSLSKVRLEKSSPNTPLHSIFNFFIAYALIKGSICFKSWWADKKWLNKKGRKKIVRGRNWKRSQLENEEGRKKVWCKSLLLRLPSWHNGFFLSISLFLLSIWSLSLYLYSSFFLHQRNLTRCLSFLFCLSLSCSLFFLSLLLSLSFISLLLYLYFFSLFLSHYLISYPLLYFTFFCIISLSFPISLGIFPYPLSPITFSPSLYFSLNWFSNF